MTKELFVKSMESMRKFWMWTDGVERSGITLDDEKMALLNETMLELLTEGKKDWGYDAGEDIDWIIEYTTNQDFPVRYSRYHRYGMIWNLKDAGNLYEFIIFMKKQENKRRTNAK